MSLPAFTVTNKLADSTTTTQSSVIRSYNNLVANLQQIFTSLLTKTQLDSLILTQIQLQTGSNTFPHTLGRTLTGWQIIRMRSHATVWDNQDNNTMPTVNLVLVSDAPVIVDLLVF